MFDIIQINSVSIDRTGDEQLGTKYKFWYSKKGQESRWLFKSDTRSTGGDWAEKVASELCDLIGLPHVHYELATYTADSVEQPYRGVICEDFVPCGYDIVHGNELLTLKYPNYPVILPKYQVREHTVGVITNALADVAVVPAQFWQGEIPDMMCGALDVFVGYLMLDLWVANQDRHHENWAVLKQEDNKSLFLSPTFDHGAALANNISDEERENRMTTRDMNRSLKSFVRKARSAIYLTREDKNPLTTLDVWLQFAVKYPTSVNYWKERIMDVQADQERCILEDIPHERISDTSRKFTAMLLKENRHRIINGTNYE